MPHGPPLHLLTREEWWLRGPHPAVAGAPGACTLPVPWGKAPQPWVCGWFTRRNQHIHDYPRAWLLGHSLLLISLSKIHSVQGMLWRCSLVVNSEKDLCVRSKAGLQAKSDPQPALVQVVLGHSQVCPRGLSVADLRVRGTAPENMQRQARRSCQQASDWKILCLFPPNSCFSQTFS